MSKITTEHLARSAYVYIRQSTADQLTHNHESRRRQYGLAKRARQLGFTTVVIDDDLGRPNDGVATFKLNAKLGEAVAVYGFPLLDVLSEGNFTLGKGVSPHHK